MRNARRRYRRLLQAVLVLAVWFPPRPASVQSQEIPAGQQAAVPPSTEEMERDLLAAVNRERASRNLATLRPSADLARMARKHSAEMAELGVLSHLSAAGKAFTDRLVDASVAFAASGENVARSETFLADFIHRAFLEHPGHRENVLNPEFDEVGIGIARGAGYVYFVTEDFIKRLVPMPAAEVRTGLLARLNETRLNQGLPPFVLIDELGRTADLFAGNRAAGEKVPDVPAFFGETHVRLAIGPDLDRVAAALGGVDLSRYDRAGIGVVFGRSPDYPGGAYFVCALFVAQDVPTGTGELARVLGILKVANAARAESKLAPLELDNDLVRQAEELLAARRTERDGSALARASGDMFFFTFRKLDAIDSRLGKRFQDPGYRRIGISTLPMVSSRKDVPMGYGVAIVLAR